MDTPLNVTNRDGDTIVVGIAGGTGSGKSTLVDGLLESRVGRFVSVLKHDDYYRNYSDMPDIIRDACNWDHPDSIDNDLFVKHLCALKNGVSVESPEYDFKTHTRKSTTSRINSNRILIVEGILIFAIPAICELLDWRIFLEATPDERVLRRILRDTKDRGRSLESVVSQYRNTTRVMHDEWIEPSRHHAHFIVPTQHGRFLDKSREFLECFLLQQVG